MNTFRTVAVANTRFSLQVYIQRENKMTEITSNLRNEGKNIKITLTLVTIYLPAFIGQAIISQAKAPRCR